MLRKTINSTSKQGNRDDSHAFISFSYYILFFSFSIHFTGLVIRYSRNKNHQYLQNYNIWKITPIIICLLIYLILSSISLHNLRIFSGNGTMLFGTYKSLKINCSLSLSLSHTYTRIICLISLSACCPGSVQVSVQCPQTGPRVSECVR